MTGKGILATALSLLVLAGCGSNQRPLPGERLDLRDGMASAPVATANRVEPLALPAAQNNADWSHRGGSAGHSVSHPALGQALQPLFVTSIGEGDSRRARITADPVIAAGRAFAMDARARITAVSTAGQTLWSRDLTPAGADPAAASGGTLATAGGRVFAATGFGELVALDAATGAELWRQDLAAPPAGAPTAANDLVFIVGRDGRALALEAETGRIRWQARSNATATTFAAGAGPAVGQGLALIPYPSGELQAAFVEGGLRRWSQFIAGDRPGETGATVLDAITGDPVFAGGRVYVANGSGRTVALDPATGDRIWTATEGSAGPLWVEGGAVFLVNDVNELIRLSGADGSVVWRVQLPGYTSDRERRRSERFVQFGPVLAGGRLVVPSSDGLLRQFDPTSGALIGQVALPAGAASQPAIAGGVLYLTLRDGTLAAFR